MTAPTHAARLFLLLRTLAVAALLVAPIGTTPARALSEFGYQDEAPRMAAPASPDEVIPDDGGNADADPESDEPPSDLVRPDVDASKPTPEILHDLAKLPEPVRRVRELIIEACKSGDLDKLRPLLGTGESATQLSLSGLGEDPIKFLHELTGDEGGQEILAILLEVMESGYVHLNAGTPSDIYVWPYYFAVPLDKLTPPQRVQLFTLITAGDYEDMKNFGAYNFYRSGITPDGRWLFFVAGD